jgi:hypothetical protein
VIDDPFVIYEIQEDTQSYTSASNNAINKVAGTLWTTPGGNTTTGVSTTQMKVSTVVTNALRPMRLLRYSAKVDNFGWVAGDNPTYAKWDVILTNSDLFGSAIMTQEGG